MSMHNLDVPFFVLKTNIKKKKMPSSPGSNVSTGVD